MTYKEKIARFEQETEVREVGADIPTYDWARALGFQPVPVVFLGFWMRTIVASAHFAVGALLASFAVNVVWRDPLLSTWGESVIVLVGSVLFGLAYAGIFTAAQRANPKLDFGDWETFGENGA